MRREQLGVLTRGMPLAEDVRLDDVAGRTPGFVAADLGALAREAGVRAALRQKAAESPTVTMAERIVILAVVLVFAAFEVWFFFFSTSSIDQRSGRGDTGTMQVAQMKGASWIHSSA